MKKRKRIKGAESVFFVFLLGILCISGGLADRLHFYNLKRKCTYQTTAYVSDIIKSQRRRSISFTVVYTYEYKGKVYNTKGKLISGSIEFDGPVILYIDPDEPDTIYCPKEDTKSLFLILSGIGVLFFMFGLLNITRNKRLYKYAENKQKADELIFGDINKE
ncbi:MAG: DUF3592 domain-containing protein [Ruminococcus sp.]|uniref:hypothetical protein n=1 Tax=Ruminococcus sp. TaxID=41978 RepID=UPI0025EDBF80|nr:hypothetical protein [Ruminococcus sp.]MCR5600059.1 DUF3592 domain-containing protein [Ruminococcus sp.]